MAGSSFFALFDDIATLLDDVAAMTKIAARKTAGVLGDDLAVNAEQVSGIRAERELPVVWAVFKGSLRNKLILVPLALVISFVAPWAVTPLLMLGGAYLCFEGFEKIAHHSAKDELHREALVNAVADDSVDILAFERDKIAGAVRTDFILSAEIIAITLGIVAEQTLATRVVTLSLVALLMTVGVYGLVAGIVKLDDAGLHLSRQPGIRAKIGTFLLRLAPYLMKTLSVVGTVAMFLVGGGIISHGLPALHHLLEHWVAGLGPWQSVALTLLQGLLGLVIGAVLVGVVALIARVRSGRTVQSN